MYYVTGGTAAQSAANLKQWFETIVCSMSTNNPIVTGPVGTREPGLFHHLLIGDFQQITGLISQATRQWTSDGVANNCTCGRLYYVAGNRQGMLTMTYQILGPFV